MNIISLVDNFLYYRFQFIIIQNIMSYVVIIIMFGLNLILSLYNKYCQSFHQLYFKLDLY